MMMTNSRTTPLKQWIIFVLRRIFCVLFFVIVFFVRETVSLPHSDQSTLGRLKKDGSVWSSNAAVTISSHIASDLNSSTEDDDDDDEDDSDEDDDDEDERVRNAIVGAVPLLLGLVAIIVLCLFMLCRRSKPSHRIKWIFRNQHQVHRSDRNLTTHAEVVSSDTEEWMHINRNPRQQPTAAVHHQSISAYHLPNDSPSALSNMDDLPPSYDDVIRGIYNCRPLPPPIRHGMAAT